MNEAQLVYPDPSINEDMKLLVMVTMDPKGALTNAAVYSSSGYDVFDAAALKAALGSTYRAGVENCQAVDSKVVFGAEFAPGHGLGEPVTALSAPHFSPGAGWLTTETPPFDLLQSVGRIVSSWHRGVETVRIAEYVTENNDLSVDRALSLVQARLENMMALSGENTRTTTVCGGKTAAQELQFQYDYAGDENQSTVFVTVVNGTIYSISYTVPQGTTFDPAVVSSMGGFCG